MNLSGKDKFKKIFNFKVTVEYCEKNKNASAVGLYFFSLNPL